MASIYGLYDAAGALRYIGKANNPAQRLLSHMRDARRRKKTPLHCWLLKHGYPELKVIEADCADWQEAERRLIAKARATGENLLNLADGGNQPKMTTEDNRKNGKRLNEWLNADPMRKRIRLLKAEIGRGLHRNYVSNSARAKMRAAARKRPDLFGDWAHIPDREENADGTSIKGYARSQG